MLRRRSSLEDVQQVMDPAGLMALRKAVAEIHIADGVLDYLVRLAAATRSHPRILQGISPRATLALASISRACAFLQGRDYVIPEDVKAIFVDAAAHRLILASGSAGENSAAAAEVLEQVPAPRIR